MSASEDRSSDTSIAVARLDAWLETMRCPGGYGGPVAHWWQQCLLYTGPGFDWRYEGIIAGYVTLWQRTGENRWLAKAQRAGDDLLAGQLPNGHYRASSFEANPATGGTPHEAACDAGLLLLALALRAAGVDGWKRYAGAAERNLRTYYIEKLWDAEARSFRDSPNVPSFVPNKAATACEALFLLAEVQEDEVWIERYVWPTLDRIVAYQVRDGSALDGAIAQNSIGPNLVEKYFPYYIARCVPALLRGYEWAKNEKYADAALRAMNFIARIDYADGSLPAVAYPGGRVNRYPCWVAALGDVLRAGNLARTHGFEWDLSAMHSRLLTAQSASGGIETASGFSAQAGGRPAALPDLRDLLPVVGWCSMALRYLAEGSALAEKGLGNATVYGANVETAEADCIFRERVVRLRETDKVIEVLSRGQVIYRWRKGIDWAEVADKEFWLK